MIVLTCSLHICIHVFKDPLYHYFHYSQIFEVIAQYWQFRSRWIMHVVS